MSTAWTSSARCSESSWLPASPPTESVWPAMSIVCPGRSSLKRSAIASAHTDDVEAPDPAAPLDAVLAAAVLPAAAPLATVLPAAAPLPSAADRRLALRQEHRAARAEVGVGDGQHRRLVVDPFDGEVLLVLGGELAPREVLGAIGGRRCGAHRELVVEEEQLHPAVVAIPLAVALRCRALVGTGEALVEGE